MNARISDILKFQNSQKQVVINCRKNTLRNKYDTMNYLSESSRKQSENEVRPEKSFL